MSRRYYGERESYQIEVSKYLKPELVKVLRKHGLDQVALDVEETVYRYGSKTVTLSVERWESTVIDEIIPLLKEERKACALLKSIQVLRLNPKGRVGKLELLPEALYKYLVADAIDGWLYREIEDGTHVAYVVRSIHYVPPRGSGRDYQPPYVLMTLGCNIAEFAGEDERCKAECYNETTVVWHHDDLIAGKTAAGCILKAGYLKEIAELKERYAHELDLFQKYHKRYGKQFTCINAAVDCGKSSTWFRKDTRYTLPHGAKMILDEELLNRDITFECSNDPFHSYGVKDDSLLFGRVPIHPFLLMFDLERHSHAWVHVLNCKPYKYDPSLREKLVLPQQHRDLIDTLCEDMDVFVDDIVAGKSGGTAILCYGAPGLGKTLTAEVYAEVVQRPLYRVQAGQLGIQADTIQENLEMILRRGERWGAVVLLDEADVYIRRRGDDLQHNAVVAAFLCKLEYFHGLLFLTTNRAADVDDAIVSRMIATFKYDIPDQEASIAIWTILSRQFGLTFSEKAIVSLNKAFPELSGRDIKQLLKLVIKFCSRKKRKMDLEAFRTCAMFRGIV